MTTIPCDRVKVVSSTTGQGASVALGASASGFFLTPSEAGMVDGMMYDYVIEQGTDFEHNFGIYSSSGGTITRATPLVSKIGGTAGTTKIDLNGSQLIYFPLFNRVLLGAFPRKGYLYGCTLYNDTDATNDIYVSAGEATDDTYYELMTLPSAVVKQLDAAWAVGTNQGGRDTGSIADSTWHLWLIKRSDTGVVDALFSTSATAPSMPANYDRKRRIGAVIRASGSLLAFKQDGDIFQLGAVRTVWTTTNAFSWQLTQSYGPSGIRVQPILTGYISANDVAVSAYIDVGDARNLAGRNVAWVHNNLAGAYWTLTGGIFTDTSGQFYALLGVTTGTLASNTCNLLGWIDDRGRSQPDDFL